MGKDKKNKMIKTASIIILVIMSLFILFLAIRGVFLLGVVGIENEGVVQYNDCREKITILESDNSFWFGKYGKQFTCNYIKTKGGLIMGGTCVLVNLDSSGNCLSAYIYQKKQANVCTDPTHPYLGYDDMCYSQKILQ